MVPLLLSLLALETILVLVLLVLYFRLAGTPFGPRRPTDELADFLADIRRHGYGVVRIDPDTVMRRSPRA